LGASRIILRPKLALARKAAASNRGFSSSTIEGLTDFLFGLRKATAEEDALPSRPANHNRCAMQAEPSDAGYSSFN
jgi:hypothetical protein